MAESLSSTPVPTFILPDFEWIFRPNHRFDVDVDGLGGGEPISLSSALRHDLLTINSIHPSSFLSDFLKWENHHNTEQVHLDQATHHQGWEHLPIPTSKQTIHFHPRTHFLSKEHFLPQFTTRAQARSQERA